LFCKIEIILWNFRFSEPIESLQFNGFIASSACLDEIIGHAGDIHKQIAWQKLRHFAGYVIMMVDFEEFSYLYEHN